MDERITWSSVAEAIEPLRQLVSDNTSDGLPTRGEFFYYFGLGQVNRTMPYQDPEWKGFGSKGDAFCKRMFIIANDFDNIVTIMHKIRWLTAQWQQGCLEEKHWQAYVKTDIHAFHAEMRSIFDSVALAIKISSEKAGQLPDSFNDLLSFCEKKQDRAEQALGSELTALIRSTNWFTESRDFRDKIIHFERDVEIGYGKASDSIHLVFRTVLGNTPSKIYIGPKVFEVKGDWILFEQYAGYYFGRLWHFLNEVCRLAGERLKLTKSGFSWVHPRIEVALECVSKAVEALEKNTSI